MYVTLKKQFKKILFGKKQGSRTVVIKKTYSNMWADACTVNRGEGSVASEISRNVPRNFYFVFREIFELLSWNFAKRNVWKFCEILRKWYYKIVQNRILISFLQIDSYKIWISIQYFIILHRWTLLTLNFNYLIVKTLSPNWKH